MPLPCNFAPHMAVVLMALQHMLLIAGDKSSDVLAGDQEPRLLKLCINLIERTVVYQISRALHVFLFTLHRHAQELVRTLGISG